jgi:AcrR family transcriptional regulator
LKKKGKQRRSRETIGTVLEAATQVLIDHGYERATTNRIAERSGFSVGTLYQYFENKEDVYSELVRLELQRIVDSVESCTPCEDLSRTLSMVLSAANAALREHPGETQALAPLLAGPFKPDLDRARERVIAALAGLLENHREEIAMPDLALGSRVMVNAAEGFALAASPEHFTAPELEHHLTRLLLAYISLPESGPGDKSVEKLPERAWKT